MPVNRRLKRTHQKDRLKKRKRRPNLPVAPNDASTTAPVLNQPAGLSWTANLSATYRSPQRRADRGLNGLPSVVLRTLFRLLPWLAGLWARA